MHPFSAPGTFGRLRSTLMCGAAASGLVAFGVSPASAIGAGDISATQNIASVGTAGSTTTVTPSADRSILDWKSFNISSGEKLEFHFGDRNWIALNRVNSGSATIDGTLGGCVGACPN